MSLQLITNQTTQIGEKRQNGMKKFSSARLLLVAIFLSIFLASCSSASSFPPDAERALEAYWQSLPSYPTITYQTQQAWPGVESATPRAPNMEVWCVETEITAAEDVSLIGETLTWIVIRDNQDADWTAAMLATMSSLWPYEACGKDF